MRRRRGSANDAEDASPAPEPSVSPPETRAVRRSLPPAGQLRRERRTLLAAREERLRDLGGLMLEMFRRDQFREDLLVDRCAELLRLDERLGDLDALLAASASRGRARQAAHCVCGAPIFWGARFCSRCGRPLADAAAQPSDSA